MRNRFTPMISALYFFSLFLLGCQAQPSAYIHGTIKPDPEWKPMVYLIRPGSFQEIASSFLGKVIDSASIDPDGQFALIHPPPVTEPVLVQLAVQKKGSRFPAQLLDDDPLVANYMLLVVEPGRQVMITADAAGFQTSIQVEEPSPFNRALLHLRDIRHQAFKQLQEDTRHTTGVDSLLMEHEAAHLRFQQSMMSFADTTSHAEAAWVAIRWVSPARDYERVPEFLSRQCDRWSKTHGDTPFTTQLCGLADAENLPVQVGDIMPDFDMPLSSGDKVMLHSILGSKITIVDIWASWCAPCRRENRNVLAPLWAAYHDKGLQILAYSIDNSAGAWTSAIAKDGATWLHASHLTGDSTPFMEALRMTTIPANYILDKDGVVIAKNLHGEELEAFVTSSLEEK